MFTIIEHEEMHQETLQYIWHRLPFDQKHRPAHLDAPHEGIVPPRENAWRSRRERPRLAHGETPCRSGGTTSSASCRFDVPAFAVDRHNVTNAEFLAFVEDGRLRARVAVGAGCVGVAHERRGHAPALLGAAGWPVVLAGHVRSRAAARRLARVCEPCRGRGVRPLARRAADDRGRVPPRGVRHARGKRTGTALGRRPARSRRAATSAPCTGIPCRWARTPLARARSACTI